MLVETDAWYGAAANLANSANYKDGGPWECGICSRVICRLYFPPHETGNTGLEVLIKHRHEKSLNLETSAFLTFRKRWIVGVFF